MSDDLNIAGSTTSMRTNQNQDIFQRGIVENGPALSRWVVMISWINIVGAQCNGTHANQTTQTYQHYQVAAHMVIESKRSSEYQGVGLVYTSYFWIQLDIMQ